MAAVVTKGGAVGTPSGVRRNLLFGWVSERRVVNLRAALRHGGGVSHAVEDVVIARLLVPVRMMVQRRRSSRKARVLRVRCDPGSPLRAPHSQMKRRTDPPERHSRELRLLPHGPRIVLRLRRAAPPLDLHDDDHRTGRSGGETPARQRRALRSARGFHPCHEPAVPIC